MGNINEIWSLNKNQAKLLKTVVDNMKEKHIPVSGASGLAGPALGRAGSSLHQRNMIRPVGKENRQYKWTLTDEWKEIAKTDEKTLDDSLNEVLES